ncbi:hypothetical protein ACROYT_G010950 [Oculina patagonica]
MDGWCSEEQESFIIFDQTMGYRDSVDPAKMKIESSSIVPSASDAESTPQPTSSGARERKECSASTASSENEDRPSTSAGMKRGCNEARGKESREEETRKK